MATRRYGISRGEKEVQITEAVGAAVASDSVEVTVDLASNLTKSEVLQQLDKIKNHIVKGKWPPA